MEIVALRLEGREDLRVAAVVGGVVEFGRGEEGGLVNSEGVVVSGEVVDCFFIVRALRDFYFSVLLCCL